jgi:hypothetical protein
MTLCQAIWDILLTAVGVFLGYVVAVRYERSKAERESKARRGELLSDLKISPKNNLGYLNQITDLHFQKGELPSFPLDTVALAYIALNARRFLPDNTDWGERYNKLRFELDHINRKVEVLLHSASILLPTVESHLLYDGKDGVLYKSIVQMMSSEFANLKILIENTKTMLKTEIETLDRFA